MACSGEGKVRSGHFVRKREILKTRSLVAGASWAGPSIATEDPRAFITNVAHSRIGRLRPVAILNIPSMGLKSSRRITSESEWTGRKSRRVFGSDWRTIDFEVRACAKNLAITLCPSSPEPNTPGSRRTVLVQEIFPG